MMNINTKNRSFYRILVLGLLISMLAVLSACTAEETGLQVGDTAPQFSAETAAGSTVSLADYEGQPVLLYFHMAVG